MDEAIVNYVKKKYNLLVGERTAEEVKIQIGSAYPLKKNMTMEVKGRLSHYPYFIEKMKNLRR